MRGDHVTQPTEPRRTRRTPGWATVPDMPPPTPDQVELLGLSVLVTVLERMTADERRRCLHYLTDRYTTSTVLAVTAGDIP